MLCGYHLAIVRAKAGVLKLARFLVKASAVTMFESSYSERRNGVTRFGLGVDAIRSVELVAPPLHEQGRIAEILLAWDKAAEVCGALIRRKEEVRRGRCRNC